MRTGMEDMLGFKIDKAKPSPPRRDPTLNQPTGRDDDTMSQEAEVEQIEPIAKGEGAAVTEWKRHARTGKLVTPWIDGCREQPVSSGVGDEEAASGKLTL
jgi:hypothetical protein